MNKIPCASLLLAVLAAGAQAATEADTTYFYDLSEEVTINGLTFTPAEAGLSTITSSDSTQYPLYSGDGTQQAATSITFLIDLTKVKEDMALNTPTVLVGLTFNGATSNNNLGFTAYNTASSAYVFRSKLNSNGTIAANPDIITESMTASSTAGGHEYVVYTLSTGPLNDFGWKVYDATGTVIYNTTTAGADVYSSIDKFYINTDYVTAVAITPGTLSQEDIVKIAKTIPEPATATLSLLALAGLAARRRR